MIKTSNREAHNKISKEAETKILEAYKKGITTYAVAKECGVTQATVWNVLKRNGIQTRKREEYRKHAFDESFFERIDSHEKASILGFIAADGCVVVKRGRKVMIIGISTVDEEHLEWIRKQMKFEGTLKYVTAKAGYKIGSKAVILTINSKKLVDDLEKLGIHPRKSLTHLPPSEEQVPDEFLNSFLLGYFEGDGWIYKDGGRRGINAGIIGTREFIDFTAKILKDRLDIPVGIRTSPIYNGKNVFTLRFGGARQVIRFMEWIYRDCPHKMKRKSDIFTEFRKDYDKEGNFIETEEWKTAKSIKVSMANATMTDEQIKRRRDKLVAKCRRYEVLFHVKDPRGQIYKSNVKSLFSDEFSLNSSSLSAVSTGKRKMSDGGWTRPTPEEIAVAQTAGSIIEKIY